MRCLTIELLEQTFSAEMKSKGHVKGISISDEANDRVLFEGSLGEMMEQCLDEGDVLVFVGINGLLRMAVTEKQPQKVPTCQHRESNLSSEMESYKSRVDERSW